MREPTLSDSLQQSVQREAEELRQTGDDYAPVNINRVN